MKKDNFISQNYSLCWKFIKESRKFIYIIIAIFFVFAFIGFFVPVPDYISSEIMKLLEELIKKTEGMSTFELIRFIFSNNLLNSFIAMTLGIFVGVFPVLFAIFNGYVLGFVAFLAVNAEGPATLLRLFPHGIFELPAVFIALGLGLRTGLFFINSSSKKIKNFKYYLYEIIRVLFFVIIPLLIIAAIIEGSLINLAQ
jgi:stage II sporulation protein M